MTPPLHGFEVHAEYRMYQNTIALYMGRHDPLSNRQARVLEWLPSISTDDSGTIVAMEPSISVSREQAVAMMAAMWRVGIRPPDISNESDVVNHLQAHIADLREELKRSHTVIRELNSIIAEQVIDDPTPRSHQIGQLGGRG